MGRILLKDFENQKNYIIGILLLAVPSAAVGFAFRMIYDCVGIILTAGMIIIYINCFFEFHKVESNTGNRDDRLVKTLQQKMKVRTKYVEIILLSAISYIVMSVALIIHGFDTGLFNQHDYFLNYGIEKASFYPLVFMTYTAMITPLLILKKAGKTFFIIITVFSILIPYGIFLLDFFTGFTQIKQIMVSLLIIVPGITIISYFIAMRLVLKK